MLRLRDVEIEGRSGREVTVRDGRIVAVGPSPPNTDPGRGDGQVIDGAGGALLPGLHDHHIHLFALAARATSVRVDDDLVDALRDADRRMRGRDWIRAVGWDDVVDGWLDRDALDLIVPDRPLRVQHRSGALWVLNSAALARLELEDQAPHGVERDRGRATGRLFGLDRWMGEQIGTGPPDLTEASRELARCGVTGVTDATAHNGAHESDMLGQARRSGGLRQRLMVMTHPDAPGDAPVKIVLAERDLPALSALTNTIVAAHDRGRPVAIHAASRATVVLAVAALGEARARPTDRLEHASVVDDDIMARIARLGVTVVTQHNFLAESGDRYLEHVDPEDRRWLYRGKGFLEAGIPLAAGSDAPVGRPDPWAAMDAAVHRRAPSGRTLATGEALTADEALALHLGAPDRPGHEARRVRVGAEADLCLLDRPWRSARQDLHRDRVAVTVIGGEVVHP